MKILLTGGSGRLGKELQKYLDCFAPSSQLVDITEPSEIWSQDFDTIIHCAGYTNVVKAETDRQKCFEINVHGTKNLLDAYPDKKFIYISSEYAHDPVNFYGWTKKWAENLVISHSNYLIIRTSFVESPFPYERAFEDQFTQGDYVELIAPMIAAEVLRGSRGLKYLGTGRKTVLELARRSKPTIKGASIYGIEGVLLPHDYR